MDIKTIRFNGVTFGFQSDQHAAEFAECFAHRKRPRRLALPRLWRLPALLQKRRLRERGADACLFLQRDIRSRGSQARTFSAHGKIKAKRNSAACMRRRGSTALSGSSRFSGR